MTLAAGGGGARILERGYRSYDGPRRGARGAMRSLVRHTVQRVLGLKRTFWNKILPFGAIFIAYVPAIAFVGIAALLKERFQRNGVDINQVIPSYAEFYLYVWAAILIFAALAVPEALCTDRRSGLLGLYLASPLDRDTYLIAKAAAVAFLLSLVTLGPPVFMLVARTIAGAGPADFTAFVGVLWRVIVGGVIVAALPGSLSLAIASTTTRRAAASAAFVLVMIGSAVVGETLVNTGSSPSLFVVNLPYLPMELVGRLYGQRPGFISPSAAHTSTATMVVAYLVITVGCAIFVRFRYQHIRREPVSAVAEAEAGAGIGAPPWPIEVTGASKWFGDLVAVSDVSFRVDRGVTALLGPNGAGKSTMLRMLCGLTAPARGTVRILGGDPRRDLALTRRIGLVPQQEVVFETLTAFEFVRLAGVLQGLDDPDGAAVAALDVVEMPVDDNRPTSTYSKGMRQRVKVAQAIVHDPDVIVLDEPLTGLDPRQRLHMIELFQRLGAAGKCVIVSSHVLDEVERFGSRVLVMVQGRLAAEGDFRAIRELMDDRPHRIRVRSDRARAVAGGLLDRGVVMGLELEDEHSAVLETDQVSQFRRAVAEVARTVGAHLYEVSPLDDDLESVFRYLVGR